MNYSFREVKCPWCDHIFMWNKNGREGIILPEYRLKETGKEIETAKCSNCGMMIAVLDHILTGLDIDDDRIEKI